MDLKHVFSICMCFLNSQYIELCGTKVKKTLYNFQVFLSEKEQLSLLAHSTQLKVQTPTQRFS